MNRFFLIPLMLSVIFLFSCKSENEKTQSTPEPSITEVLLSIDKLSAVADGTDLITFTSKLPDGTDVTTQSEFFVDDTKIDGNTFSSTTVGEYKVHVVFKDVKSTVKTITITAEPIQEVSLKMDKIKAAADGVELITFSAELADGTNVTSDTEFFVNDEKLANNTFSTTTMGEYEVYASYQGVKSGVTKIEFTGTAPTSYTTKILVEDFTGAWCGYCPRVAYKLEEAQKANPNVIPVGVHSGDNMEYRFVKSMERKFKVEGYPTAILNRRTSWGEGQSQLDTFLGKSAKLGLGISSEQVGDNLNVNINVGFKNNIDEKLKLVVYIVEDGLLVDQRNYMNGDANSPWFNAGDPIVDYEHNHTLRAALTDIFGDEIPASFTTERNTYTVDLSIDISAYNADNLSVIAFVVEGDDKNVQNAQIAKIGTTVDFD